MERRFVGFFFFQAEDGIRDGHVTGVQTCALPISRPVPDANHVAWQLGHLIWAECRLVEAAAPGSMPELPAGFGDRYARGTAGSDNPADFFPKEEYLRLAKEVRTATLKALDKLSEADLDKPISG